MHTAACCCLPPAHNHVWSCRVQVEQMEVQMSQMAEELRALKKQTTV